MTDKQLGAGDLEKTAALQELFQTPHDRRDEAWADKCLANLADASFRDNPDRQVIIGPDGLQYFVLFTPEPGVPFSCFVIRNMIPQFLLEEGWGIVINPGAETAPDWVFRYGDLLNFALHGQFSVTDERWASRYNDEEAMQAEAKVVMGMPNTFIMTEALHADEDVVMGMPDSSILPDVSKALLKTILNAFGLPARIALMERAGKWSLVFPYTPDMFAAPAHFQRVMGMIDWLMPRQYTVTYTQENGAFHDL
jgi:hypothetical protein